MKCREWKTSAKIHNTDPPRVISILNNCTSEKDKYIKYIIYSVYRYASQNENFRLHISNVFTQEKTNSAYGLWKFFALKFVTMKVLQIISNFFLVIIIHLNNENLAWLILKTNLRNASTHTVVYYWPNTRLHTRMCPISISKFSHGESDSIIQFLNF